MAFRTGSRKPRNAHAHVHVQSSFPSSFPSQHHQGSSPLAASPLTLTNTTSTSASGTAPEVEVAEEYNPYSPTSHPASPPSPPSVVSVASSQSTLSRPYPARTSALGPAPAPRREGGPTMSKFDPFDNSPRPRRKTYSPFSAFESSPRQSQVDEFGSNGSNDGDGRPTSMISTYSYTDEPHMHSEERVEFKENHSSNQRKSGLSFEIGGPEDQDETDTDREHESQHHHHQQQQQEAPVHFHSEHSHSYQEYGHVHEHQQIETKSTKTVLRPSTGDSTPSSREEDSGYPSGPASSGSAPECSAPEQVSEQEQEQEHEHEHERIDIEQEEGNLSDLAPPRPRFLKDSKASSGERGSWSSQDSSLYPPSQTSSTPNSDSELVSGSGRSDSEREVPIRRGQAQTQTQAQASVRNARGATGNTRIGRERANTAYTPPVRTGPAIAYKKRSGSFTSVGAAASGPVRGVANTSTRRYSGGATGTPSVHRRSMSSSSVKSNGASGPAQNEIEEVSRSESESASVSSGNVHAAASTGVGAGPRTKGTAPPSSYRGSRTSFSGPGAAAGVVAGAGTVAIGLPPGAAAPVPGGGVAVPDVAHPLSPNLTSAYGYTSPSEEQYPGSPNASMYAYAHQYPHSPNNVGYGYQYPPSPPPVPGAQGQQQQQQGQNPPPQSQGAQPVYPGGANYPGGGSGYPYNTPIPVPPAAVAGQPGNMNINTNVGFGSGYATPVPRAPPPPAHNAFMANSAIARSSIITRNSSAIDLVPYAARLSGIAANSRRNSFDIAGGFAPPQPPFAHAGGVGGYPPPSPGTPPGRATPDLHHAGSSARLREPFLSPASRRSSSVWAPPTPAVYAATNVGYDGSEAGRNSGFFGGYAYNGAGDGSNTYLALPGKKEPLPSSALQRKISVSEKPWVKQREKGERAAWWLTFCVMWIGVVVGAVVVFFGFTNVRKINNNLCSMLDDDFSSFNTDTWSKNVSLGGFGNGEFQMTTDSSDNLYIKNGQLYIMPTLTSDEIGSQAIFDGYTYNLTGCTESWNASACNVRSDQGTNTVVNPVKSARISTRDSVSIAYGKVEVVAKMPKGDWLWPAIWMLPKDEKYGAWPRSGEIDIVEARGNSPEYPRQGNNFVRSSLNWGPLDGVIANAVGWQSTKRSSYATGFHTYTLEWTPDFIRISVDSKLRAMLDLNIKRKSFFDRGKFPTTAQNGSTEAVVQDIWEGQPNAAPFDQEFYLIIDLAVGGTSGWFPDNAGGKMWFDGSATAMTDFAKAQDTWSATWPSSDDDRALRVDSVKMWKLC